jgi:hypothetical protein
MIDKRQQAIWNGLLWVTLYGWIPSAVWACWAIISDEADTRTDRLIEAIRPTPPLAPLNWAMSPLPSEIRSSDIIPLPPRLKKVKKIKDEGYWC